MNVYPQEHSEAERDFGKVDHAHSSPEADEFNPWSEAADGSVWGLQDEGGEGFQYVNLELNPEKFTGYVPYVVSRGSWNFGCRFRSVRLCCVWVRGSRVYSPYSTQFMSYLN